MNSQISVLQSFITASDQQSLTYSQSQSTIQKLFGGSTSAPNLHLLGQNLINHGNMLKLQNDTFAHQDKIRLTDMGDTSQSLQSFSHDQSQNQSNQNTSNFKLISQLIKQQLNTYSQSHQVQQKEINISQLLSPKTDGKKQSLFLSQLQELNSSQEDGQSSYQNFDCQNSRQKQIEMSCLDNLQDSFSSIDKQLQIVNQSKYFSNDFDDHKLGSMFNNGDNLLRVERKRVVSQLDGRIETNQSQSFIHFEPQGFEQNEKGIIQIKNTNTLQITQTNIFANHDEKFETNQQLLERQIRIEQQNRIEEHLLSLKEHQEQQTKQLDQFSQFDTSQISLDISNLEYDNLEGQKQNELQNENLKLKQQIEQLEKQMQQKSEQIIMLQEQNKKLQNHKIPDLNIMEYLSKNVSQGEPLKINSENENCIYMISRIGQKAQNLVLNKPLTESHKFKLKQLCQQKQTRDQENIQPNIQIVLQNQLKQTQIQLLDQITSPGMLRRTKTLINFEDLQIKNTQIYDDCCDSDSTQYRYNSNKPSNNNEILTTQEEYERKSSLNLKTEYSTLTTTEGLRTTR